MNNNTKPAKPKLPVVASGHSIADAEITRLKCEVFDLSMEVKNLQQQAEVKVRAIHDREQRIVQLMSAKVTNGVGQ